MNTAARRAAEMKKEMSEQKEETLIAHENFSGELNEPRWSVVTFDACAESGLTYDKALKKMKQLAAKKISGLCIVTDEVGQKVKLK